MPGGRNLESTGWVPSTFMPLIGPGADAARLGTTCVAHSYHSRLTRATSAPDLNMLLVPRTNPIFVGLHRLHTKGRH